MRHSTEFTPTGSPPIVRPRTRWELAARTALDQWSGSAELNVAAAIEEAYGQGIAFAAKFIEGKGQQELARMLRAAGEPRPPDSGRDATPK